MLSRRSPWLAIRLKAASAICSRRIWVSSFSSAMMNLYCDYTFTIAAGQESKRFGRIAARKRKSLAERKLQFRTLPSNITDTSL